LEESEEIKAIKNPVTKQVAVALRGLALRTKMKELMFTNKLQNKTKELQQAAY
jgi:hypothetical protein